MQRILRLVLVVATCWGAAVLSAEACGCASEGDLSPERQKRAMQSEIDSSRAVFVGELVATNSLMLRFRVQRVWKGDVGGEVVMSSGARPSSDGGIAISSCEVSFSFGTSYVVFANGDTPETMRSHACSSTGRVTAELVMRLDALVKSRPPSALVAPRQLVAVIGTVRDPGVIEWKPGLTVAQALALVGGPIPVVRPEFRELGTLSISSNRLGLPAVHRPALPDALLYPDDQLFVVGNVRKRPD